MRKFLKIILITGFFLSPNILMADDDYVGPVRDELTKTECSDCHMAYQAIFLPKASWRNIMGDLENHFGEDASLDEDVRAKIEDYLVQNAGRDYRDNVNKIKISELRWFTHEHSNRMLSRQNVKSFALCNECHKGAERGYYDDD